MIPLPFAIPWRLVGWAAIVAAVALMGWRVAAWREAYKALPAAEEALQAERECGEGSKCAERVAALQVRQEAASAVTVARYEDEIEKLRSRPVTVRTVRLCPPAGAGDVRDADAAGSADGTGPAAGVVSGPPGRDIGPELYQLAREADEVAARLRALQQWNQSLAD